MEHARRLRVLVGKARAIVQHGGDRAEALHALDEALALLRKIEGDRMRFRDLLTQPVRSPAQHEQS